MTTTTANTVTKSFTRDNATVAQPAVATAPIVTGTLGYRGVVEYTRATPKVVSETYAVIKK